MGVTQQLAKEVVNTKFDDIPEKAVERIRRGILDSIGDAFLGYSNVGEHLVRYAKDIGDKIPESTLIGDGSKVSCAVAAGINAQLGQSTNFTPHGGPGGSVLSSFVHTGLAVAERVGATSGKDLITAVALAFEINARFHRAAFPVGIIYGEVPKRDTSFLGSQRHHVAVAAITAAKLLGLEEEQVNRVMGIAWYFGPQPSAALHELKRAMSSLGLCHWGIQAALLAQHGFEGPQDFIESEGHHDLDRVVESPSPYYYTGNELHIKPYISSRGTHPGISAAVDIVKEEGINLEDIEEIRFKAKRLYFQYPFDNPEPTEYWDTLHSVQWAFAMALMGYQAGPEWLTEERRKDPVARTLSKKVKLLELPRATEIWESGVQYVNEGPNEVELVAKGKVYKRTRTYGEAPGSSLNPMPEEWLERKFKANSTPVIGEAQSQELFQMLGRLQEHNNLTEITHLFKRRK